MALARNISTYDRMENGSAARSLPQPERVQRPQAKPRPARKKSMGPLIIACTLGWACVMAFSLMLVHQNTVALERAGEVTALREQLAQLKQENEDYEKRIDQASSMAAVEQWAIANGMTRQAAVKPLEVDTAVMAALPVESPAAPPAPEAAPGIWGAMQSFFGSARGER